MNERQERFAQLVERFKLAAVSASSKDHVSDLTNDEAVAICFFSHIPYTVHPENGSMNFERCGLYKWNGKWIAIMH